MPVLLGRSDSGAFTANAYIGFASGGASLTTYTAAASGTANTLYCSVNNFGSDVNLKYCIYEQVGGAGAFDLVAEVIIDAAGGTGLRNATITPALAITATNVYSVAIYGDVSSTDGGVGFQVPVDDTVVSPLGVTSFGGTYATPTDPRGALAYEADGEYYWHLFGDLAVSENLGVVETLEVKGTPGTPISDRSLNVTVLDPADFSVLVATASTSSVSGVVTVDSQLLGALGDEVLLVVEDPALVDDLARIRMYRVTVIDLDA